MRAMMTVYIGSRRSATTSLFACCIGFLARRENAFRLFVATVAYPLYLLATATVAHAWWSWGISIQIVTIAFDVVVASVAIRQLVLERPRLLALRRNPALLAPSCTRDDTLRSRRF